MRTGNSKELLARYRAGESEAAAAIFERYVDRLVALAQNRLSAKMSRRVDPEDVAQSAFRSFFLHAREGEFEARQSGDLWRLLAQIALHKLYAQVERHQAKRRSIDRDVGSVGIAAAEVREPGPVEVVALVEQIHRVLAVLDEEPRRVLSETLRGESIETIAKSMSKSPRSVRRYLSEARERIESQVAGKTQRGGKPLGRPTPSIDRSLAVRASDYSLERMLGAGGMGKVYRAVERSTGKTVAIKALRKRRQDDFRAVQQFVQEAQILASLRHPNIVKLHGIGEFPAGGLLIVMDYVGGGNLETRMRAERMTEREAVNIVRLVSEAVAHANDRGIVHADLKPANILLTPDGQPIVTDFGFSRIVAADGPNGDFMVGGTVGYMAPEVYRLEETPTVAADVFGLGALLWALSTGRPPARGEVIDGFPGVGPHVARICRRCLMERPGDRFRDVHDLVRELRRGSTGH